MRPENCKVLLFIELQQAQVPESLAAKKLMYMRPRIVRGRAKYDDFRLSLRHQIKEKHLQEESNEFQSSTLLQPAQAKSS